MPSTSRRALLASLCVGLPAVAGCIDLDSSAVSASEDPDPHWVTVYLQDREQQRDVSVTITDGEGATVFERAYHLSDRNEADENATFPASTDPESIVVTVDGTQFERDWPGFEQPELPCGEANEVGIELWIETAQDGRPEIRLFADCQSVRAEQTK
ncbi:hypothetical protein [Salinarchaeum laminariae]|uniref:hypothetical protein n=1 Tax=Salinarchaeum laminariae TaxID=869888 RepID=UPI0020C01289|nr:hypothetical protein [Salinarchaeum laminariae]